MKKTIKFSLSLCLISLIFCGGCLFSQKIKSPPEPEKIAWGRAGEQPTQIWPDKDWIILDKDYFMKEVIGR